MLDWRLSNVFLQSSEVDQKIQETRGKILVERKVLEGTRAMKNATTNQDVLRRLDAKIRDSEASLTYFEETLQSLLAKKRGPEPSPELRTSTGGGLPPTPRGWSNERDKTIPPPPDDGSAAEAVPKKNYTNLGTIRFKRSKLIPSQP